jgi:hypothetical protein
MEWCLNCHRQPEKFLRPREEVFNMGYQAPNGDQKVTWNGKTYDNQVALGNDLAKAYHLRSTQDITNCSTCHR